MKDGCRADFVTTAVPTGESGAHGLSLLVIEKGTPGFSVNRRLEKMGWHCSDTAELSFYDVRVPASHLVGAENSAFGQIAVQFVAERLTLSDATVRTHLQHIYTKLGIHSARELMVSDLDEVAGKLP